VHITHEYQHKENLHLFFRLWVISLVHPSSRVEARKHKSSTTDNLGRLPQYTQTPMKPRIYLVRTNIWQYHEHHWCQLITEHYSGKEYLYSPWREKSICGSPLGVIAIPGQSSSLNYHTLQMSIAFVGQIFCLSMHFPFKFAPYWCQFDLTKCPENCSVKR
jgi:hypothetical protein